MRLIDAEPIEKFITDGLNEKDKTKNFGYDGVSILTEITYAPTVDAEPVRHGHWVNPHWRNANYCCDCSECHAEAMHEKFGWHKSGIYHICPNCGAKMDENKKDA